jgi:integrase
VGKETYVVKEQSTGFNKLTDAREYVAKLESDIRESILNPNKDRSNKTTFDDCLVAYLNKKRPKKAQLKQIQFLLQYFEGYTVDKIKDAWTRFCSLKQGLSSSSLNRYANVINSILNCASEELNISPTKIKTQQVKNEVIFMLTDRVRPLLLNCYSEHSKPIFTVFAYQGLREQENLQLQWEDIDLKKACLFIRISKNGESRQVPMHKKTWWAIAREWVKRGKPITGHVWLNVKGKPYTDTRKTGCGGSPIRKAHVLALQRLKKEYNINIKMNVHSWRHDWAGRMVMAGVDLLTVKEIGGWKSLDMVKRYASLSNKHKADAINKI